LSASSVRGGGSSASAANRAKAFTTLGLIAVTVREAILPHVPKIFEAVTLCLPTRDSIRCAILFYMEFIHNLMAQEENNS
jgi:hypothetical protein